MILRIEEGKAGWGKSGQRLFVRYRQAGSCGCLLHDSGDDWREIEQMQVSPEHLTARDRPVYHNQTNVSYFTRV
jgi:hypothetical protein